MASPLASPVGSVSGATLASPEASGASVSSLSGAGLSALSPHTLTAALDFRTDAPASLTKALAAAAAANPASSAAHLSDEHIFDFDELLGRSADTLPEESALAEAADADEGDEGGDDGDAAALVTTPGKSQSQSAGRIASTMAPGGAAATPPLSKSKSTACVDSGGSGGNVGAAGSSPQAPRTLRAGSISLSLKDLDQQSRKSLGVGDFAPDAIDPKAEARALRRFSRPRMGSSTTLWVPGIERHAANLGAGRLRVAVPDGLGAGEELTAVCPDGRRVPLQLPEGNEERAGRQLIFFLDMPKVIWQ